ncbi:hypothetical protein Tco_0848276 [Tanacetum coccineum]
MPSKASNGFHVYGIWLLRQWLKNLPKTEKSSINTSMLSSISSWKMAFIQRWKAASTLHSPNGIRFLEIPNRQKRECGIRLILAPKSARAFFTAKGPIRHGSVKLPGSPSFGGASSSRIMLDSTPSGPFFPTAGQCSSILVELGKIGFERTVPVFLYDVGQASLLIPLCGIFFKHKIGEFVLELASNDPIRTALSYILSSAISP